MNASPPPAPRLRDLLGFQFGHRPSIEHLAASRWTIPIGLILVASAALARNFSTVSLLHHPMRLAGPFLASLITSLFIFAVAFSALRLKQDTRSWGRQYLSFLGLFLMTAPLAWFYAVPVEHFMSPLEAAKWNFACLGMVSLWRVALLARVFQVVTGQPATLCVAVVLAPASLEVLAAGIGYQLSHLNLAAAMSGIGADSHEVARLEESVMGLATLGSFMLLPVTWFLVASLSRKPKGIAFPVRAKTGVPVIALAAASASVLLWLGLSLPYQRAEFHYAEVEKWFAKGHTRKALDHLARVTPSDLPGYKALPPDPWAHEYFHAIWRLKYVLAAMKPEDPAWVQQVYFEHARVAMDRVKQFYGGDSGIFVEMTQSIAALPEGADYLRAHQEHWVRVARMSRDPESRLAEELRKIGIDVPAEDGPRRYGTGP